MLELKSNSNIILQTAISHDKIPNDLYIFPFQTVFGLSRVRP